MLNCSDRLWSPFNCCIFVFMVFFLCALLFVFGLSPFTLKSLRKQGGQREWSSEGTASGPLLERAGEGGRAKMTAETKRPENTPALL